MIELILFGTPGLRRDGEEVTALLVQPRRFALLAYLAATKGALHRRDRLLLLFWGDQPESKARASLRQALHFIRRSLGDVIVTRGNDDVGLDAEGLWVDTTEIERAVDEGRYEDALALYRGDFLAHFNVDDAPEFERWAAERRREFRRSMVEAAWKLSDAALAHAAHESVVRWARRAVDLSEYAEGDVRRGIRAASAAGDRSAGLELFETLKARLASELDATPEAATSALAAALLADGASGSAAVPSPRLEVRPAAIVVDEPAAVVATGTAPPPGLVTGTAPAPSRARSRIFAGAIAIMCVCVLAAWLLFHGSSSASSAATHDAERTIAVMPFSIRGGDIGYLREGMVDLLSISLQGAGDVAVVEPIALLSHLAHSDSSTDELARARATANAFDAGSVVTGTIVETSGTLNARVSLYETRTDSDEPLAVITGSAKESDVVRLVDDITRQLLATRMRDPGSRLRQLATQTTTSLPALKSYLRAEEAMRTGRYHDAIDAYDSAVAADSGFALAYYGLSMAQGWASNGASHQATRLAAEAVRRAHGLSAHDSLLLVAHFHHWSGSFGEAEAEYRSLVESFPNDVEGRHELGEVLFHTGWLSAHAMRDARDAFTRVANVDALKLSALDHLARIAAAELDSVALDSLAAMAVAAARNDPRSSDIALLRTFCIGDSASRVLALASLGLRSDRDIWLLALDVANYAAEFESAESIAALLTTPAREPVVRAIGWSSIAQFRAAAGRPRAAREAATQAASADQRRGTYVRAFLAGSAFVPTPRAELVAARAALVELPPDTIRRYPSDPATLLAMESEPWIVTELRDAIDIRLGKVVKPYGTVETPVRWGDAELAAEESVWQPPRDTAAARALLGQISGMWAIRAEGRSAHAESIIRYVRADLLEQLGYLDDATRWFTTFPAYHRDEMIYRGASLVRLASLAERRGNRAGAERYRQRANVIWRHAEQGYLAQCATAGVARCR